MFQTMWTGVLCCTKYKSNSGQKAVYNSIMLYFMALIMTDFEFSKDPENELTKPWPKYNLMAFNKMMINICNK